MTRSLFLIAVRAEIKRIKRLATTKEIARLNFRKFKFYDSENCIYGQMTGYCGSERARKIMQKSFCDVAIPYGSYDPYANIVFKQQSFARGRRYTALEKYIYMCEPVTHIHIIDFIKDKTKVLNIE